MTLRLYVFAALLASAFLLGVSVMAQESKHRLVPSKVADGVVASIAQDGRAIDVKIWNQSEDWVVLNAVAFFRYNDQILLDCEKALEKERDRERAVALATAKPYLRGYGGGSCDSGFSRDLKIEVQPKSTASVYLEAVNDRAIWSVSFSDVRGREATLFERARAKLR